MPRIQMYSDDGARYEIASSSPAIIAAWLCEMAHRFCSANVTYNHPIRMDVWPIFSYQPSTSRNLPGRQVPDWEGGEQHYQFRHDQMHRLMDLLDGITNIPDPPQPQSEQLRTHGL